MTTTEHDPAQTLATLFREAATRYSGRPAVVDPLAKRRVTYGELEELVARYSGALAELGIRAGMRVGFAPAKSIEAVAWLHAILRTGAAYVPLDHSAPVSRSAFTLLDCDVAAAVVAKRQAEEISSAIDGRIVSEFEGDICLVARDAAATHRDDAEDLAYIFYTSGSTGTPKGVVHTHASALHMLADYTEILEPSADDVFSALPGFHFDMSTLDMFLSVMHGASIVLINEDLGKLAPRLAKVMAQERISIWWSVPTVIKLLLKYGRLHKYDDWAVRAVLFGGEPLEPEQVRAAHQHWPKSVLYNIYGSTEATIATVFAVPKPYDSEAPLPIGGPSPSMSLRIADADGGEVGKGEKGEVFISGPCILREYWGQPERTAAALVEMDDRRWYRTGDVAWWGDDGLARLAGRRDRMVKRRGYRIELSEIETALRKEPDVEAATAVAFDLDDDKLIHCFVVAEDSVTMDELKQRLATGIPAYMVPDVVSPIDEIPLTSTGKTDFQTLIARARAFAEPSS